MMATSLIFLENNSFNYVNSVTNKSMIFYLVAIGKGSAIFPLFIKKVVYFS